MNNKVKKVLILPLMILIGMLTTINVNAAGFNISRSVTGVTNKVTNTFSYTVTAVSGNPGTVNSLPSASVAMSGVTPSSNTATGSTSIATATWTGLTYPSPGLYKFKVSETASNNATIYPVDNNTYYEVHVYVTSELDGNDSPTGTLVPTYVGSYKNGGGNKILGNANATFTSAGVFSKLTITNTVKGSLANPNEYFKYSVTVTGFSGDEYSISVTPSGSPTYGGQAVSTSSKCTVSSSGSCVATIYLKHGQTATVGSNGTLSQLPRGKTFSVSQDTGTSAPKDYTTTVNNGNGTSINSEPLNTATKSADFINTKSGGTVPSGVFLKMFPFVLLLVLSIVGIILIRRTPKLED